MAYIRENMVNTDDMNKNTDFMIHQHQPTSSSFLGVLSPLAVGVVACLPCVPDLLFGWDDL